MSISYPRVILAGVNSGVGKTTLAIGIMLALKEKNISVQPFKTGPDYIDPTYHLSAAGRISYNLDSWLLSPETILELFTRHAKNADLSIIEGVMGLYDGMQDTEQGSTAHLAKLLNSPVILILDAHSLSRSAAAIALGYKEFDRDIKIEGVILNNIGSRNHLNFVKNAIETKTKIKVVGFLPKSSELRLSERHLGLIPTAEMKLNEAFRKKLSNLVKQYIDLESILKISQKAQPLPYCKEGIFNQKALKKYVTIGIARDKVFNFYYEDNLAILKNLGAKLVEFSPLSHKRLPKGIDGLYIGGGFPELFAEQLSKNIKLKKEIYELSKGGLPIYAECGGLMYLMDGLINFKKREFSMVGIFKGSVNMNNKLRALGYATIETIKDNILSKKGARNRAHIFHWSYLEGIPKNTTFAYRIRRKDKEEGLYDGLVRENVLASYAHLHFASNLNFAKNFIKSCEELRRKRC